MPSDAVPRAFGKYQNLRKLGEGGNGPVYNARQPGLERLVALEAPSAAVSPEPFATSQRQIKVLGQLRHQNIVRLLIASRRERQQR